MLGIYKAWESIFIVQRNFTWFITFIFQKTVSSQQVEMLVPSVSIVSLLARQQLSAKNGPWSLTCFPGICTFYWNIFCLTTWMKTLLNRKRGLKFVWQETIGYVYRITLLYNFPTVSSTSISRSHPKIFSKCE